MDYFECVSTVVKRRRSIRQFNKTPVDTALVKKIIETASHAPSNNNRQGWKFYLLRNADIKQEFGGLISEKIQKARKKSRLAGNLMDSYHQHFMHFINAPVVVVCCFVKPNRLSDRIFDENDSAENRHMSGELISLSLVIQNMLLLAESAELGTLVMTSPLVIAPQIRQKLQIPQKYAVGAFVCMGYYDKRPAPPRHYGLDRILQTD